ncbi:MAG: elongation factor P [Defluviitaleaceae bacterium]|nr:elongation factor P [Defluviitaleaceae bacterium]
MISAGDFKNGVTIECEGEIYVVMEFQHSKSGRAAAVIRTKLRNIVTGGIIEKTFRPAEKMPRAHIERKDMQYLYKDGDLYHFMDLENYEQIPVDAVSVGDSLIYIKENDVVKIMSHNSNIFGIEPPISVELEVKDTEPGFAGNTATGATKPATLETGAVVTVPLFVNIGDVIKVDTRTGEYTGRVQQ